MIATGIARRDVIKWGMAAPALVAAPKGALAMAPQGLDAMLLDERFAAQMPADLAGVPLLRFSGDLTRIWYDTLDRRWRAPGHVLGGITGSDALFVLEVLATQHGRRVVSRTQLGVADQRGLAPVRWIIAPHHPSVVA